MKVYVWLLSSVSFANYLITVNSETFSCKLVPFETREGISGNCCVFFKNSSGDAAFPNRDVTQQILDRKNKIYSSSSTKENDAQMEQILQNGNKISCKMIPIETKEGTSGNCCVIFKNVTQNSAVLKEGATPPSVETITEANRDIAVLKERVTPPSVETITEINRDSAVLKERVTPPSVETITEVNRDSAILKERVTPPSVQNTTEANRYQTESTQLKPTPTIKDNDSDKFLFPEKGHQDRKQNGQNQTETAENITIKTKNAFDTPEKCLPPKMRDHTGSCTEPF